MPQNFRNIKEFPIDRLKEYAEQLQEALQNVLKSTTGDCPNVVVSEEIERQIQTVLCRSQDWRSDAFFVIVVGPVKSGKSTFVNLLAHEKVSPTHFLECTVRPSIISQRKTERSEITSFITNDGNPKKEEVDSIINDIEGLCFVDSKYITKEEPCELSKENLDKKVLYRIDLHAQVNGQVALTSITAKGGAFLQDKIYLIDMPGFDGVQASLDEEFYEAIVNRADLVVFVQSSNSAINKISEDFCKKLKGKNGSVPIYFVHNYFDSAYWHTEKERNKVTEGHIQKAREFFGVQNLAVNEENVFCINLRKVSDARDEEFLQDKSKCIPEYKDMLKAEENRFCEIEKILHDQISEKQHKVRLQNCINRTIQATENLNKLLESYQQGLEEKQKEYDNLENQFKEHKNQIPSMEVTDVLNIREKRTELIRALQNIRSEFCQNINVKDKYNTERTRQKANDLINTYQRITEDFVRRIIPNSNNIQQSVKKRFKSKYIESIPIDLNKYFDRNLCDNIQLIENPINVDFSSINKVYNIKQEIQKYYITTRTGGAVVDCMIDIEHRLFGLSEEKASGYIPTDFFDELAKTIEKWIYSIIEECKNKIKETIEHIQDEALKKTIPDVKEFKKEKEQIKSLIEGVSNILNSQNQQNNAQ